jgi:hypothetical protein
MEGDPDWVNLCRDLNVDYIFWGRLEQSHYPESTQPWATQCPLVAEGDWGQIYDAHQIKGQTTTPDSQ